MRVVKTIREFVGILATEGGHVIVCMAVLILGVWLAVAHGNPAGLGRDMIIASMSSLWTAMQIKKQYSGGFCPFQPNPNFQPRQSIDPPQP